MYTDILNIGLGFLEGFALIISPCILPILPIILAGSLTGGKKRPLGIIAGFVLVFSLFTFFSRKLVEYSGIDLNLIRQLSYAILILLGLIMVSNYLSEKFSLFTQGFARVGSNWPSNSKPRTDFISGLLFGSLVALVWTPCAGPILAAVIVQTVIQRTTVLSFLTLMAFAVGAAGPMLVIALFGRSIMPKFSFFKTHTLLFRKILGAIILLAVLSMIYFTNNLSFLSSNNTETPSGFHLEQGLIRPYSTPAIGGITAWINSQPLQLSALKGKVVLIDFWTYSCINCIRTLPYLKDWYAKYHDQGLVIIGIHTPEFDFEKNLSSVKEAVSKEGILYPVALDNQFITWRNFNNSYWPAHYLINKKGEVVYTHFGEGEYGITESNIRFLLGLNQPLTTHTAPAAVSDTQTPETYFGYDRAQAYSSPDKMSKGHQATYHFSQKLPLNAWSLQGGWTIAANRIISTAAQAALRIHFSAGKVYIVMGSTTSQPIKATLLLNGKTISSHSGKDVKDSSITIKDHRLYEALNFTQQEEGILELQASSPGLEIYTFTFGK